MASNKSKEDTWKEDELKRAIKGDSKERKHRSRDKDKDKESKDSRSSKNHERSSKKEKERSSDKDKERKDRKSDRKDDHKDKEHKEKERDKDRDREKEKRKKEKERIKDTGDTESHVKEKDRKHRDDKEKRKDKEENDRVGKKEREDRDRNKDRSREKDKERRRDKDGDGKDKSPKEDNEKRHKEKRHKDDDNKRERKTRDKDLDADKENRKDHKDKDREKRRRKHDDNRDEDDRKSRKDHEGSSRDKSRESSSAKKEKEDREAKELRRRERKEKELQRLREIQEQEDKRKKEEEAANEYDYEDDFDDYEDDFESEEEEEEEVEEKENNEDSEENDLKEENSVTSEEQSSMQDGIIPQQSFLQLTQIEKAGLQEMMQAMNAENKKVSTSNRSPKSERRSKNKESSKGDNGKKHGNINFVAANKKQINDKVAQKTKKRGEELLGLVQLDVRSIELFDMPPMTEYELYMKRFGSSDTRQIFTQTNDEYFDQDCQTDDIETETRWCQHTSDSKSAGTQKGSRGDNNQDNSDAIFNTDSVRLNKFLLKASKVCLALLEEIAAGIEQPRKHYVETRSNLSEGYVSLGSSDFLVLGRDVCDVKYSPSQTNMLLTAHGTSNVVEKGLKSSKGLLCVWNTNDPNKPTRLLVCESVPTSCCFGGVNTAYALAGMEDGVVAIWDLTESSFHHEAAQIGNNMLTFQNVTFTTAALDVKHIFPVVAITPLTFNSGSSQSDMSFQLATMDQSASVHVWTIVRTQGDDDLKNVTDDLGLAPHGRVKLVHSTAITPPGVSITSFTHLFSMTCLKVNEANPNDMYAGTGHGEILHMTRFNNRPKPRLFRQGEGSNKINAIDVCPWKMPYMLACYDDGCVRLFHTKTEDALMTWANTTSGGVSLNHVQWSRSRPTVFFTMDSESVLYIWNLLESDVAPLHQMKIQRKDKRAVRFALANDYSALGKGSPGRPAEMAIIFGDGSVEIHRLTKQLFNMGSDELDKMESFLSNIT